MFSSFIEGIPPSVSERSTPALDDEDTFSISEPPSKLRCSEYFSDFALKKDSEFPDSFSDFIDRVYNRTPPVTKESQTVK